MTPEAFIAFATQHETHCHNSHAQVAMIGNVVRLQCSACHARLEVTFQNGCEHELDAIAQFLEGSGEARHATRGDDPGGSIK